MKLLPPRSEPPYASPASVAVGLLRHAERTVSAAVGRLWPDEHCVVGKATADGSKVLFHVEVGQRTVCATYSLLGWSLASLVRGAREDLSLAIEAQQAQLEHSDGPLAREAKEIELLRAHTGMRMCDQLGLREGVLVTSWVDGPSLAERVVTEPDMTMDLLVNLWGELRELHQPSTGPLDWVARRTPPSGGVSPLRAGGPAAVPRRWLGSAVADGWLAPGDTTELQILGPQTVARLGRLGRRLDPKTEARRGVCYGGLTPHHVLYPALTSSPASSRFSSAAASSLAPLPARPSSERPVLVSPALGVGGEVADLGRMVSRLHLLLVGSRPGAEVSRAVAYGVDHWIRSRLAADGEARQGRLAALLTMWAADTLSVLSETLSVRPGVLPLPPSMVAAGHRCLDVIKSVDTFTSVLQRCGADHAMRVAIAALASAGEHRADQAGRPRAPNSLSRDVGVEPLQVRRGK
ncbi:MAG: hypothetical protein ACQSGP_26845 [Frankia sp.]